LNSALYLTPIRKFKTPESYVIKPLLRLTQQLGQRFLQIIEHGP